MQFFGSVVEHYDAEAGAGFVTIASGQPFICYGFTLSTENGNAEIVVADTEDTVLFHIFMGGRENFVMNIPFVADKGLKVSSATNETHVHIIRAQVGT